jgi:hypothetical protein
MRKILVLNFLIIISFFILGNSSEFKTKNENKYEKNLKIASVLYLNKTKIPESILIKLVPENYTEFRIFYGTTAPDHQLGKTNFFYHSTRMIFEQVTSKKNNDFYLPSLNLASFADGEYAEEFIEYLQLIIKMDKEKFCESISQIKHRNHNPIKYYSELNKCE